MTPATLAAEIEDLTAEMDGADLETRLELAFEIDRLQFHHTRLTGAAYEAEEW